MIKITEALIAEHSVFCALFENIERSLPGMKTVAEIRLAAGLIEGLLVHHRDTETELAYVALDHLLADKGRLDRLNQDHEEISAQLRLARSAKDCGEAKRLLKEALDASRAHFQFEEDSVFPLIGKLLQDVTLEQLGDAWMQSYLEASRPAEVRLSVRGAEGARAAA
jgi:hemerythrin-like domain-containing protein